MIFAVRREKFLEDFSELLFWNHGSAGGGELTYGETGDVTKQTRSDIYRELCDIFVLLTVLTC